MGVGRVLGKAKGNIPPSPHPRSYYLDTYGRLRYSRVMRDYSLTYTCTECDYEGEYVGTPVGDDDHLSACPECRSVECLVEKETE